MIKKIISTVLVLALTLSTIQLNVFANSEVDLDSLKYSIEISTYALALKHKITDEPKFKTFLSFEDFYHFSATQESKDALELGISKAKALIESQNKTQGLIDEMEVELYDLLDDFVRYYVRIRDLEELLALIDDTDHNITMADDELDVESWVYLLLYDDIELLYDAYDYAEILENYLSSNEYTPSHNLVLMKMGDSVLDELYDHMVLGDDAWTPYERKTVLIPTPDWDNNDPNSDDESVDEVLGINIDSLKSTIELIDVLMYHTILAESASEVSNEMFFLGEENLQYVYDLMECKHILTTYIESNQYTSYKTYTLRNLGWDTMRRLEDVLVLGTKIEVEPDVPSTVVQITESKEPAIKSPVSLIDLKKNKDSFTLEVSSGDSVTNLDSELIKAITDNNTSLEIKSDDFSYTLSNELFAEIGKVEDIIITISKLSNEEITPLFISAENEGVDLLIHPVRVTMDIVKDGKIKSFNSFNSFVVRKFEIPSYMDPQTLTTGVVFNEDNSFRTVPTTITYENGKYYAIIQSLTNSVYSVVNHEVVVASSKGRWSSNMINEMASRLILRNVDAFRPEDHMTRADFSVYMANALGLDGSRVDSIFTDIYNNTPINQAIVALHHRGIINGYSDGTFKSENLITREEMGIMIARACQYLNLSKKVNNIKNYTDTDDISPWATDMISVVELGVYNGYMDGTLKPKRNITHEEGLQVIYNTLKLSKLID